MSIFKKVWAWIKGAGHTIEKDAAPIIVAIFNGIKQLLGSGELDFLAQISDGLTHSELPTNIVAILQKATPNILATALSIENLPDNPTPEQLSQLSESILKAFGVLSDKSKFYTVVSADMYGIVQSELQPGVKFTYATFIDLVQKAFNKYQEDLAASQQEAVGEAENSDTDAGAESI